MQISKIIIKGYSREIRSVTGQLMGDWFSSFRLRFSRCLDRCSTDGNNMGFRNDFEEWERIHASTPILSSTGLSSLDTRFAE